MAITFYNQIHEIISKICKKVKLTQSCISSAMFYFHKFFISKKFLKDEKELYVVCLSCIYIATKSCDELIFIDELITCTPYTNIREEIFNCEFVILDKLGFDVNVTLPYKYLLLIKNYLDKIHSKLFQIAFYYINDSFKLPVCLYYEPYMIVLSCVFLLKINFKIDLPKTGEGLEWYSSVTKDVDIKEIIMLSHFLNKINKVDSSDDISYNFQLTEII
jgi:hypothetical protein